MAVCFTDCNDCGEMSLNVYVDICPLCGSTNVDKDYDDSDDEKVIEVDDDSDE